MAANPVVHPAELRLESEKGDGQTTVRAAGRITSATAATLESALRDLASANQRLVLDLTHVDYIDSSGLGALVAVYMHATRAHCELEIANPKSRIRDLFGRSGLGQVFKGHGENYFEGM